jgi:ornithine carbamoyltransferase
MIAGHSHLNRRPLLSLADLRPEDISDLCDVALRYGQAPQEFAGKLEGARVGLVFAAPSTRTRLSFWSAARTLGADVLHMGHPDLQVSTGETWGDTGAIMGAYLDVVVARTNGPQRQLVELAAHVPATINALTYEEHPTQAIADLCAMREHFGSIQNLRIAYMGEINNTARSLAWLVSKLPFERLDVYSPEGSGFTAEEIASLNSGRGGNVVCQHYNLPAAPDTVDVVYTTRWQSMGVPRQERDWLPRFMPFAINKDVMRRFSGSTEAVLMHDLPAVREQEVTSDVLDGKGTTSLVQEQVRHKASAAASALLWAMGKF